MKIKLNKNKIKELLLTLTLASAIYIFFYIVLMLIYWDVFNPFKWLNDISKYSLSDIIQKLFILSGLLFWSYILVYMYMKDKEI